MSRITERACGDWFARPSYFTACRYCKGRPLSAPAIEAAVQIKTPLPYTVAGPKS